MTTPARNDQDRRDEENRLWAHGLHTDNSIVQRGNYFLVAQSMLVVAYSILLSVGQQVNRLAIATVIIAVVGMVLAGVWGYVSWSGVQYLRHIQHAAVDRLPEYKQTRETWRSRRRVSALNMFTYVVPSITGVMWGAFLVVL
ncbi:RipA family octameric membrane protein [Virgisporangium aurantiacum]|uniref:RipA family octameric membrane protein n=1 Tax=Virgisporangium aurantiacum TaxID=175570 RepID=UPI00194F464E|nr:hypothetical protein [Virgisporangium aurantiacum]